MKKTHRPKVETFLNEDFVVEKSISGNCTTKRYFQVEY